MTFSTLMAISPIDGRYAEKTTCLRAIFSEYGLVRFRVIVEIRWLQHLSHHAKLKEFPSLSKDANNTLDAIIENFSESDAINIKKIESTINHDVKAIEYFIKERIANIPELAKISEFVHFGCTSEDINNLAYALMLDHARKECIVPTLEKLISQLKQLANQYKDTPMLSRTHGQPATPTTIGKEFANVIARLQRQMEQLLATPMLGKMNGATGNYNALTVAYPKTDWQFISKKFVTELGLHFNAYTTQIEPHDYIAELFAILMRVNTILIDLNRDLWSYIALNYFKLKTLEHEVGSSTMPHKVNPIDFENAEGNLGIANALLDHMALKLPISRWQRDLTDSTVLRNIGVALAHALLAYQSTSKGLDKITPDLVVINADLEQHWEILAEPIQMMLRRFGVKEAYEKLKTFSRGQQLTQATLHQFIATLDLPENIKQELYQLTPQNYLGHASDLAKQIL